MITSVSLMGVAMLILGVVFLVLGGFEGIGLLGIGAIALGIGKILEKLNRHDEQINFIIGKMGWKDAEEACRYLTPEQWAKRKKKNESEESGQKDNPEG